MGQDAFTSCQIAGRNTEVFVCHDDQVATYRYGPIGGPTELLLSETVEAVDFEPWSGSGKAIHEQITFYNGDVSYEVGGGFDRPFSEEEMLLDTRRFGWINVAQNGEALSRLECIPETVTYGFGGGIYDQKVALGLVWDERSETWMPGPNRPTNRPVQAPLLSPESVIEECISNLEIKLGDIALGYHIADLAKLLPPVIGRQIEGLGPEFERFMYDGLRIDTFEGVITELETTSSFWWMPSGIMVGTTRGEVISILGRVPYGATAKSRVFGINACMHEEDAYPVWYVVIRFGHDKRVQSISLASSSP